MWFWPSLVHHVFTIFSISKWSLRSYQYLGLCCLTPDLSHCVIVADQCMDTGLGPDVPHPGWPVSPTGQQHVYRGVEIHGVHSTQVTVIVPDGLKIIKTHFMIQVGVRIRLIKQLNSKNCNNTYFVILQIPASNHFVFSTGEQIWLSLTDLDPSHSADMPSQGQF